MARNKNEPADLAVAEGDSEKMDITVITAIIDHSAHVKIPVSVFEYELPVIEEIFGQENVQVTGEKVVSVDRFNAADAHAAMIRKYRQNEAEVRAVYRGPKSLARESDLAYERGDENASRFTQAEIYENGVKQGQVTTSQAAERDDAGTDSGRDDA
jgi:hypothetical protein